MKTTREKLEQNDWYINDEACDDSSSEKYIDNEFVRCYFKKSTSEIYCVEVERRYLTPNFIKELNEELKKLEVNNNEN